MSALVAARAIGTAGLSLGKQYGKSAGNFVMKNPAGQVLGLIGLDTAFNAASDYFFGTDAEQQKELVEELMSVRKMLNDPGTPIAQAQELAARDAEIQNELESLGVSIEAAEMIADQQVREVVPSMGFDEDNDGEYTLAEISRMSDTYREFATVFKLSFDNVPRAVSLMRQMLGINDDGIKAINTVMR
jgi:hypothetical protein